MLGGGDEIQAYNASGCGSTSCSPLWNGITSDSIRSSPAVSNGLVYVISSNGGVYTFNATGCGKGITTCQSIWAASTPSQNLQSSPVVAGGVVYVGSAYPDGKLYAFNAKSGKLLWTATTAATGFTGISTPTVDSGMVYVASPSVGFGTSYLYAFNASGCGKPSCSPVWTATLGNEIDSSPVVVNGALYINSSSEGILYAFHLPGTTF